MEIQELGALGELVGGIAVIATLVYLAIQTRHYANEARRLSVNSDEGAARFPMQLCRMTETPENVEVLRSGLSDFDSLPPAQAGKFNSLMLGLFIAIVTVSDLNQNKLIPPDEFEASENNFLRFLSTPGGRQWWDQSKKLFPSRGVAYIEGALDGCGLEPITENWLFLQSDQ
jgi:hypothetical protein